MVSFRFAWFDTVAKNNFGTYLQKFKGGSDLRFLEIGCFEGKATLWLLENILTDQSSKVVCVDTFQGEEYYRSVGIYIDNVFNIFLENIDKYKDKVIVLKGKSQEVLRREDMRGPIFDFIYIDGSHKAPNVLEDAILGWRLLKKNGIMIFDDYYWQYPGDTALSPKIAIDYFLTVFGKECIVLLKNYQVVIEKV